MTKIRKILLLSVFSLGLLSCSDYANLLKGRDYEKQYQEALKYYEAGKNARATNLLLNVNRIYGSTERADTIRFYLSNLLYRDNDFEQASQFYDSFRKNYGRSPFISEAEFMYAMSFYQLSPNSERDQTYSLKAISAFNEFIYRYPNDPRVPEAKEKIDELQRRIYQKEFEVGQTYYNIGNYVSAITSFKNILKRHPDIPYREEIRYTMLKAYYNYARKSVKEKQRERFLNVVDAYYSLVSEFPDTQYKRVATRMFNSAQAVIDGRATVDDVTIAVKSNKDDIYAQRTELQQQIADLQLAEKGKGKIKKLKKQLEKLEKEITELETKQSVEDAVNMLN